MNGSFYLRIISPEKTLYSGEAEYLSYEATDGRVGIMCGALPRIGAVSAGRIEVTSQGNVQKMTCGDGVLRVTQAGVDILITSCVGDGVETGEGETGAVNSGRQFDYAKARIAKSVRELKDNTDD